MGYAVTKSVTNGYKRRFVEISISTYIIKYLCRNFRLQIGYITKKTRKYNVQKTVKSTPENRILSFSEMTTTTIKQTARKRVIMMTIQFRSDARTRYGACSFEW